jgi:thioredoxin-like negative regulator of GroEL
MHLFPRRRWTRLGLMIGLLVLFPALTAWPEGVTPKTGRPAILDFGRGVCPTCKQMEVILEKLKAQYADQVEVRLVYLDKEESLFTQYRIMIVPTQVFLDASGKEVDRHIGLFPEEELVKKLQALQFLKEKGK